GLVASVPRSLPLSFTLGVWCVLSMVYLIAARPDLVPAVYVVEIVCLFAWR
ncbi:unnamed protein product, partial [Heterosigma akashiwo]